MNETEHMGKYFLAIENQVLKEYEIANAARAKGFDPEDKVDSPLAKNMVERVEGLISAVAPQLIGSGVTDRMFELEKKYGVLDWRVSLVIAEEVAQEKFCKFKDKQEAMEVGIRTGFAYHTLGIVAAPLEGFIGLDLKKTRNGEEYFSVRFSGPIRGAGGTGASVCVLIADYVRKKMGYAPYDPDENEVKRYPTELNDYHDRVTNLQYHPTDDEVEFLIRHIPVEVAGDPTEKIDVSNYKDLPRVESNKIRGGMCLVMSMIALKAPKLLKRLSKWNDEMDMDWGWMGEFVKLQKAKKAASSNKKEESGEKPKIAPNTVFIADLVAGRPILTYPLRFGGFRLRYGRARTSGYSASAIHPATMYLLQKYIAVGTQLKLERPGKAASMTSCDTLDGPIVRLTNGNVVFVDTLEKAKEVDADVEKILFLGDILFNYGDFSENGHSLVPSGYCPEWWAQDVAHVGNLKKEWVEDPLHAFPGPKEAVQLSQEANVPLHPKYILHWKGISVEQLIVLIKAIDKATIETDDVPKKIIIPFSEEVKKILERIGLPHVFVHNEYMIVEKVYAYPFLCMLGLDKKSVKDVLAALDGFEGDILSAVQSISTVLIKDKSGTFIGARMGRPEKAKMRKMNGSPHCLFPVGEEGGRLKSFQAALQVGKITSNFAIYKDKEGKETFLSVDKEGNTNEPVEVENYKGDRVRYKRMSIDIKEHFYDCLAQLKTSVYPDLIKGVKKTSNKDHIPEHLMKGIIRAKHDVYVNKDGSCRYDMTELPITHFKPHEVGTPIARLQELGYVKDIYGNDLTTDDQILELRPQDIILPGQKNALDEPANEVLFRVGNFIDELLEKFYGQKPYYKYSSQNDVVGSLVVGLAPHISAGMIGRIIGFSKTAGCFAHPLWHAALRRDCDGDEASVSLLLDSLLNFSRQYLPDRIGSRTMDAPLVLTAKLVPSEVDDMVHGLDVLYKYPKEFYEAALEYKQPWEVPIEQLGKRVNTPLQYEDIGFTHDTVDINAGVLCSAYKILPSMQEKLDGQMKIAEQVDAVDTSDVARLVIEKHFIRDIKGNLRKFSMQGFRCVACNEKYRRPPLVGKCQQCGGKILFTISEGSVIKYLGPSMRLAEKYDLDPYLKETLQITQARVDQVFGKEKEIQAGLGNWC